MTTEQGPCTRGSFGKESNAGRSCAELWQLGRQFGKRAGKAQARPSEETIADPWGRGSVRPRLGSPILGCPIPFRPAAVIRRRDNLDRLGTSVHSLALRTCKPGAGEPGQHAAAESARRRLYGENLLIFGRKGSPALFAYPHLSDLDRLAAGRDPVIHSRRETTVEQTDDQARVEAMGVQRRLRGAIAPCGR